MGIFDFIKPKPVKQAEAISECFSSLIKKSPGSENAIRELLSDPTNSDKQRQVQLQNGFDAIDSLGKCSSALMKFTPKIAEKVAETLTKDLKRDFKGAVKAWECNNSSRNVEYGINKAETSNGSFNKNEGCQKELNDLKNGGEHNKLDSVIPTPENGIQSTPEQASTNNKQQTSKVDVMDYYYGDQLKNDPYLRDALKGSQEQRAQEQQYSQNQMQQHNAPVHAQS